MQNKSTHEELEGPRGQVDLKTKDYAGAMQQIALLKEQNRKVTEALDRERAQFEVTLGIKDKIILNLKK